MIYDTLQKRRYVLEYDHTADIPKSLIDSLLKQAWKVTPSKNNYMPYTVNVIGPEYQEYKKAVFLNCFRNQAMVDNTTMEEIKTHRGLPRYSNILNCSYVLILTMRLETQPNLYQQYCLDRGQVHTSTNPKTLNNGYSIASFEAGLFLDAFGGMCLEHDIDTSFTGCFQKDLESWKDVPFIKTQPIMIMTVGKGIKYRDLEQTAQFDLRPDYERIVNFIE
jgi:hypothetical protein